MSDYTLCADTAEELESQIKAYLASWPPEGYGTRCDGIYIKDGKHCAFLWKAGSCE